MKTTKLERWHVYVDKHTGEKYKQYLREHDIYFEPSEDHDMVYISFDATKEELEALTDWERRNI